MKTITINIPLPPPSKKNSNQLIYVKGKPRIIPNKKYNQYLKDVRYFLKPIKIDKPINLKCLFYVNTRHRRDLVNYLEAIQDVLVHYEVITDDNYQIVESIDGSRIIYDKETNPHTDIVIEYI